MRNFTFKNVFCYSVFLAAFVDFYLLNAVVCRSSAPGYFNSPLFTVLFTAEEQKRASYFYGGASYLK